MSLGSIRSDPFKGEVSIWQVIRLPSVFITKTLTPTSFEHFKQSFTNNLGFRGSGNKTNDHNVIKSRKLMTSQKSLRKCKIFASFNCLCNSIDFLMKIARFSKDFMTD